MANTVNLQSPVSNPLLPPLISIQNLSYAYPILTEEADPVWVLDGVDLEVVAGEFVAVMGATGCGKTTLCLALNGLLPHATGGTIGGDVWVNGRNSKKHPVAELAQTVGLIFQEPETQLFNMTAEMEIAFGLENLGLAPAEMHERIDWALALVGMSEFRQRSPFQLSGGQKQRIAIAAMLAMRPQVLVLDEPTANLDPVGKREVFTAVSTLRQQYHMTIIMVSHESEQIAEFADRVVVLDDGKVVLDDVPTAVFAQTHTLNQIGIAPPQVSETAQILNERLGTDYVFTNVEEAGRVMRNQYSVFSIQYSVANLQSPVAIKIDNLHFSYGETAALQGGSAEIGEGDLVAILGQNGSGKTTLAKHLNGLLRPSQGYVELFGEGINGRSVSQLARTVGYVFQNPDHQIFSPTVREELAVGPRNLGLSDAEIDERVDHVLTQFGLDPYADQQPTQLSFGLRRKVSVAAVVAMETAVLILDEPTTGLDWRNASELMAILQEMSANGRTIILITHDMRLVAEFVPRCLVMANGRIIADDSTRNIFQQDAILQKAQLQKPQISELGERLGQQGVLTVQEFCNGVAG